MAHCRSCLSLPPRPTCPPAPLPAPLPPCCTPTPLQAGRGPVVRSVGRCGVPVGVLLRRVRYRPARGGRGVQLHQVCTPWGEGGGLLFGVSQPARWGAIGPWGTGGRLWLELGCPAKQPLVVCVCVWVLGRGGGAVFRCWRSIEAACCLRVEGSGLCPPAHSKGLLAVRPRGRCALRGARPPRLCAILSLRACVGPSVPHAP